MERLTEEEVIIIFKNIREKHYENKHQQIKKS